MQVSKLRLLVVFAVIGYVIAFNLTYRDVITPIFNFWGLGYRAVPSLYYWMTVVLCIIPSLWVPVTFTRPTLLLFYMQYLIIYIPASFLVFYCSRPPLPFGFAMKIVLAMFIGLSIIESCYLVPIRPARLLRLSPGAFWLFFGAISTTMLAYLVVTLSGNFQLAAFSEVNSVRFAMGDVIAATGSRFGVYSQTLLMALFFPTLFAVGAFARRWWLIGAVAFGYVFIFGIGGAKQAALAIIYLPLAYVLLSRPKHQIPLLLIGGLGAALLSGYISTLVLPPLPNVGYLAVVHFRLFTVPALLIPQYADFFQTHPLTYLSHVTGINWLLQFPYDEQVAYVVGRYYYSSTLGANSGVWATDGIAAFGIWGIPLISCFAAAVFWVLDAVAADMDPSYVGVMLTYCAVSFTNISLFTTLVTAGMGFVILALLVAPRDQRGRITLPTIRRAIRLPVM